MHFGKKTDFSLPIAAIMRQKSSTLCEIMIENLGSNYTNIVVGSSFFQNYAMELTPGPKPQAVFQLQKNAAFGSLIADKYSNGAVGLAIIAIFLLIAMVVMGISYVCSKFIKRNYRNVEEERTDNLIVEEDDQEEFPVDDREGQISAKTAEDM
jgi:Na+-transporting methylmalonyl-CoA/oxaloacetate decarboxylase gamma subunit